MFVDPGLKGLHGSQRKGRFNASADLDDFTGPNARRAGLNSFWRASDDRMHLTQVWIPAPFGDVVRVTNMISVLRTFSAEFADPSHCHTSS